MTVHLFYSNHPNPLVKELHSRLYIKKSTAELFTTPIIIAPNPPVIKWLKIEIGKQEGLYANIDTFVLDPGLFKIFSMIDKSFPTKSLLDHVELSLLISHYMLENQNKHNDILSNYLFQNNVNKNFEVKVWQLSTILARLFIEYEYHREAMILQWMSDKTITASPIERFEQKIYFEIMKPQGVREKYFPEKNTLFHVWLNADLQKTISNDIFIFGISYLSPFHAKLIFQLGKMCNIHFYQLNPCSEFWEDLTSPFEDRWNRIKQITVEQAYNEEFLSEKNDENILLKLWGKPGRETLKLLSLIEEAGSQEYALTTSWLEYGFDKESLLTLVKKNILSGQNNSNCTVKADDSLPMKLKDYQGTEITIHDNRGICCHDGSCVKLLPKVFRRHEKPWINPNGAIVEEIIEVVKKCPSGALSYTIESKRYKNLDTEPMIKVSKNGPLEIKGFILLKDDEKSKPESEEHFCLCRCGGSKNKPFCDGSHHENGFEDEKN